MKFTIDQNRDMLVSLKIFTEEQKVCNFSWTYLHGGFIVLIFIKFRCIPILSVDYLCVCCNSINNLKNRKCTIYKLIWKTHSMVEFLAWVLGNLKKNIKGQRGSCLVAFIIPCIYIIIFSSINVHSWVI